MTNRLTSVAHGRWLYAGLLLFAWLATVPRLGLAEEAQAKAQAESSTGVPAVWKPQEINFYLQTFTTAYACRALTDKVEYLLRELGAGKDLKVRANNCFGNEISRTPYLKIKLVSPVEATPQALAELEKTRTTRELAARVKGERPTEVTEQFPAQWKKVSLSRGKLGLQEGDCELIAELKRKVLPKLAVRIVKDDVSCAPYTLTMGQPRLEVEALSAMPKKSADIPPGDG